MITQERYDELKDKMVWIKFCHADESIRAARDREHSKVEYEPILVKLEDALSIVERPEEWEVYDPKLGVDSRNFRHGFATPGYPVVDKMQKGTIRELKEMGHEVYQRDAISFYSAYIKPMGEPEEEVTAPLLELWFGEYKYETKKLGSYTGKTFSQQQIKQAHDDVEIARTKLGHREIVSPEVKYSERDNFGSIADCLGIEEGEIVLRRPMSQRYVNGEWSIGDLEMARAIRDENGNFALQYPFSFPRFSADQSELRDTIESIGTSILEHHGRSGFASRNSYTVKPSKKSTEYDVKVIDEMWPAYKDRRYMTERENFKTIDYCQEDVEKAFSTFQQVKDMIQQKRIERFGKKISERSLDGVFSVVSEGGHEEKVIVPEERFIECFRLRTANTQDHRQNLSHTEDVGYIDIEKAKNMIRGGKLHVNLPEEYIGKMIGAKGSNIKRLQEIIGQLIGSPDAIKIILHAKTKEEVAIRLSQIQNALDKQKSQTHDDD